MEYLIFQDLTNNEFRIYSVMQNRSKIINHTEFINIKIPKYYMLKNDLYNDLSEESLKEYSKLFEAWRLELLKENIDILKSYNLHFLVTDTYFKFCSIIKDMPTITSVEYNYIKKLNQSSAMYFDDSIKNIPTESYSYDFKNFYNKSMISKKFNVPNSVGKQYKLDKIPEYNDIKMGIYNVEITSNDDDFRKVFIFSSENHYTDITLKVAIAQQKKYNIDIKLNTNCKYNCLIYDTSIAGEKLFKKHFEELTRIKDKYPKNKLVKFLISSLYGHLAQKNILNISSEDYCNYDISFDGTGEYIILNNTMVIKKGEVTDYFTIAKRDKIYKYNVRLAPWLISFCRNKTYSLAQEDLNNVIRIQTDCVVFRKPMLFIKPHFNINVLVPEEKSSGLIKWTNINSYSKQCDKCNEWVKVSKMASHQCN